MRTLPAALLVAAAVGCAGRGRQGSPKPIPARSAARDSLLALDIARADSVRKLGPVTGVVALLADDVAYLRGGVAAVYGRESVAALLNATLSAAGIPLQWQPLGGGLSADGRFGFTYGIAEIEPSGASTSGGTRSPTRLERYIAVWRRTVGGAWRVVAYSEVGGATVPDVSPTGTAPPPEPVDGREGPWRADLRQVDNDFSDEASRSSIADAFSSYVAPNGILFAGPELVTGPAEVHELFARGDNRTSLVWHPVHSGVASSGDLGFTVGEWVRTGSSAGGAVTQRFGKYLTVWRKMPNGKWRFVADGGSPSPASGSSHTAGRVETP
jgi:ketosteroid isomerase-like protein